MKNLILLPLLVLTLHVSSQTNPSMPGVPFLLSQKDPMKVNSADPTLFSNIGSNHFVKPDKAQLSGLSPAFTLIDSIKQWVWDTIALDWNNFHKTTDYTYDSANRITGYVAQDWNGSAWTKRFFYQLTYDANGDLSTELYQDWDGNAWRNSTLFKYTFDVDNNLLSRTGQYWNGSFWVNSDRFIYTYDGAGNQLSGLIHVWNGSSWDNDSRYFQTFDANNNQLTYHVQGWENNLWVDIAQYLYVYDAQDNLLSITYQNWDGNNWLDFFRSTYVYDANNNRISELNDYSDGTSWINNWLYTYTYDANNLRIHQLAQNWTGSAWADQVYYTYAYDANLNNSYELRQMWSGTEWVKSDERTYIFDTGNLLLSAVIKFYNQDGITVQFADSTYYYFRVTTGTHSIANDDIDMNVYPNPSKGKVTISSSLPIISMQIFNLQGQVVHGFGGHSARETIEADLSQAGNGMYFAKIVCEGKTYSKVIVIQ